MPIPNQARRSQHGRRLMGPPDKNLCLSRQAHFLMIACVGAQIDSGSQCTHISEWRHHARARSWNQGHLMIGAITPFSRILQWLSTSRAAGRWGPAIKPVSDTLMFEQNLQFKDWRPIDFKSKLRLLKSLTNEWINQGINPQFLCFSCKTYFLTVACVGARINTRSQ